MKRASGILLPITSLPSRYGIGCFSKEAYEFVDMLKEAGQSYWQILPLGPTSYGDSPYQSFSTYAGNPYFIDLESLIEEGLLTKKECDACDFGRKAEEVDYGKVYAHRMKLLRRAYTNSHVAELEEFHRFQEENRDWLKDYAVFMAVKEFFGGVSWIEWPEDIRMRYGYALDYYRRELYFDIEFQEYVQYLFAKQWKKLKEYANERGIGIIGDIPIYVAFDSADSWSHPELFQFDEAHLPSAVAGCPPDGFSATGQLWGNPLYRWDYHRDTGYEWWIRRIEACCRLYDVVRIDHFRGFDAYYSIPFGDETAENGHWEQGPGMEFFTRIRERLGDLNIIAEDLGFMTDSVRELVRKSGYPNMKVLEFAFDSRDTTGAEYLPYHYDKNCVVYTGTHDNETIVEWYETIRPEDRALADAYLNLYGKKKSRIHWEFIRLAMLSTADLCVIPMQDYLGLPGSARMNEPSTLGKNWKWRLVSGQIKKELTEQILRLTKLSGRG